MKIFLSWSGPTSHALADLLRAWLPTVLPAAQPWLSTSDIPKGAPWSRTLAQALEGAAFGIVCITPDNLDARWLNYEAGALSKVNVAPLLFDLDPSEVSGPLSQYQMTVFEEGDLLRLLETLNRRAGAAGLQPSTLKRAFDKAWPKLLEAVGNIFDDDEDDQDEVDESLDTYEPDADEDEVLGLLANLPEEDDRDWIELGDVTDGLRLATRRAQYILQALTDRGLLVEDEDDEGYPFWVLSPTGLEYVVEAGLVEE